MRNRRKLAVKLARGHVMHVTRRSTESYKLAYVILVDKKLDYEAGRSRIAYIGSTKNGVRRIAASMAKRSYDILGERGVRECFVHVVTCSPRRNVQSWKKLERALMLMFRETYGEIPRCNVQGSRIKEADEFDYFSRERIARILEDLA